MTKQDLIEMRDGLEGDVRAASLRLKQYPRNQMGKITDDARSSDQYRTDRRLYNMAFTRLRNFNAQYAKVIR